MPTLLEEHWCPTNSINWISSLSEYNIEGRFEEVNQNMFPRAGKETNFFNRTFTSITPLRPTIFANSFRPSPTVSIQTTPETAATTLDLLPKISAHPALSSTQVRCGPRNTFSPSHFVRKRRHGFLSRLRTRKGRALLQRRKAKKRSTLSH